MPDSVPVILLGRLAVSTRFQRKGLGRALVRFAAEQSIRVSHITGCIGLATAPINSAAQEFYEHLGFRPIKNGSSVLLLKLAGLEKLIEGQQLI